MSEWQECKLGEQINLKRGYDLPKRLRTDGCIPIYSSSGVTGFHSEEKCTGPGVIAGRYGTIGQIFFSKEKYWPLNTTLYVQDFKGNNELFVYYFLQQIDWEQYNDKSAVPGVNRNDVHQEEISLPPLPEQEAIAQVLSSLDDKIDLLHRQNKTLEAIAETLFRQWFIEEAQDDWEEVSLGSLGIVITGKTPSTKATEYWGENIDFVTPTDFRGYEKYAIKASRGLSIEGKRKSKKILIPAGSILTTCIGSDMGKVVISVKECVTNQQINSLTVTSDLVSTEYVYQCLRSIYPLLRSIALGGTTMPIINKTDFSNIEVFVPPKEQLIAFDKISSSLSSRILYNTTQAHIAEKLRDTLLPKLMSGEVRVDVEPDPKAA